MRGNTITITMPLKRGKVAKTDKLFQYDYGQKLIFTGVDLPEYYEVHFSNEMHGTAVTSIGDSTGVDIPDNLLETGDSIYLWLFLHDEITDGETEFQGVIPVIKRAHVDDQVTPHQQTAIEQAIAALNNGLEIAAEKAAEIASGIAADAAKVWAIGTDDPDSPAYHNSAKEHAEAAEDAKDSAETAQEAAEAARAAAEDARDAAQLAGGDFQGLSANITGLEPGAGPTIEVTHSEGGFYNLSFGIPAGQDGADGEDGQDGQDGADGVTFTPSVSNEGVISWTNDGSRTNPTSVNIKGPKGDKGDTGDPAPAEDVADAVDEWLEDNFSNPSNPPLDRTLLSALSAAPADMVGDLKSALFTGNSIQNNVIDFADLVPKSGSAWEQGTINTTTGVKSDSDYRVRTKDYVILQNGKTYAFKNIYDEFSIALFAYNSSGTFQSYIRSYINYDFTYTNSSGSDYYVLFVIMRKNESPYNPLPVSEIITNGWYGYENGTLVNDKITKAKNDAYNYTDAKYDDTGNKIIKLNGKARGLDTDVLSGFTWEQGGYSDISNYSSPGANTASTRIRAEKTITKGNYAIECESDEFAYVWAAFDSTGAVIEYNAGWQTGEKTFNLQTNTGLLRIAIKKTSGDDIVPADFADSEIYAIKNGELIKLSDLQKYISDKSNTPIKLKVITYNIGRFSYGVSPYYLSENYDEKLANYRSFFSEQQADIVGLQECNTYLDTADATGGTHGVNDEIFDYLYPDHHDLNGFTCLKSKYTLKNKGTGYLTTNGRQYVYANIELSGKTIFVMSVHLTPNAGQEQEAKRAAERAAIIDILDQHDYAICFGDFNAQTGADFKDFTDEGYKIANGGYLPMKDTYGGRYNFEEQNPMDNIVVTPNIIIDDSKRLDVFTDLSSDHVPFVAWLTII